MPWSQVPIHREPSRSNKRAQTTSEVPSNSGIRNGFQTSPTNCCNPPPGPRKPIPTHMEPSGLAASPIIPGCPSCDGDCIAFVVYTVDDDEAGFHRTSAEDPAIQTFPRVSVASRL